MKKNLLLDVQKSTVSLVRQFVFLRQGFWTDFEIIKDQINPSHHCYELETKESQMSLVGGARHIYSIVVRTIEDCVGTTEPC